jgi:hypothetical protein
MQFEELAYYRKTVDDAKEQYPDMTILFGAEVEWCEDISRNFYTDTLMSEYRMDYLIGSAHYCLDKAGHRHHFFNYLPDMETSRCFCNITLKLIESGLFTFIAHPDAFMTPYNKTTPELECMFKEIISAAVQYDVPLSREWQLYTYNLCQEYGVSFEVMLGLMYAESTFRFDCVSYNGSSFGICQINKCHAAYAKSIGMEDFKEPANNIKLAVMFLKGHLNNQNGDYHKALICYNCGAGGAQKSYFSRGVYQSTYSKKVMNYANNLKVA